MNKYSQSRKTDLAREEKFSQALSPNFVHCFKHTNNFFNIYSIYLIYACKG